METRIACLRIPRFTVVALGGGPEVEGRPVAVATPGSGERVHAASAAALDRGVLVGMRLAAARALASDLDVRPWDEGALARAVNAVTTALLDASPQVTPGAPGLWWIGAHGLRSLGGERALLGRVLQVARTWHPGARAALASSCVAARAATFLERELPVIPPGQDAEFLARAPLALLPMDAELREALAALGMARVGQLAALAPAAVEARFGDAGLAAWRLARGEDPRRPALAVPPAPHVVAADLPAPATTLEPVLFLVRAALDRLAREVARDGRAIAAFEVGLLMEEGTAMPLRAPRTRTESRRVACARPMARPEPLFEQCRAVLEGWVLEAPVVGVVVQVTERVALAGEQGDLLNTGWRDPAAAEAAFARLRGALGGEAVVRAEARDAFAYERRGAWGAGHPPIASGAARPRDDAGRGVPPSTVRASPPPQAPPSSLRLLGQPEIVELVAGEPPVFFWRGRWWPVLGRERRERLSGEWWSAPYARDYERWVSEGARFLVFRSDGRWVVQGWWD